MAILAGGKLAVEAGTFYFVTILGAFGVVGAVSGGETEAEAIDDYRGLFWERPGVAVIFTAILLSLVIALVVNST